ncbi:mandelate racemase/muconate lactonizing enzyme family protein [Polynucleobacter sp. IMCC 29146]|uniref:mandelate racemase/muconate lactonizing enzyme family protein n=1 Tax=Polynucleobacter sp. IMCC 29146 TaxID=2780953 RepID=UPI001F3F9AA2|nr:mandelate racemase/muconate lactonizing enzyme family protein [Polynucleobacter sp. IMCC 29146]MCE7529228.1 mandelate racemase/muconate lactonizing enzyme family protein [Polynucleobacter sp. IMCC 29146]
MLQNLPPIDLVKAHAIVYRAPIAEPVQTSFGLMHNRPALVLMLEDRDGNLGWGEIWCNFPTVGAEHRARLFEAAAAPLLLSKTWASPEQVFSSLTTDLHILSLQSGEPGPIAQVIAGIDMALWDLIGKKLQQPLWQIFNGSPTVQVYASGINPRNPEKITAQKWAEGYRAFKLKIGFDPQSDLANLANLRALLGADTPLMLDANQAWTPAEASECIQQLAAYKPFWIEEPIAADSALSVWQELAKHSPIPLAAGENMRGMLEFTNAIESKAFAILQPDMGKWGGFSAGVALGQAIVKSKNMFCPHWLGGGIGLIASMHLKASANTFGFVEVDANPNPLRELLAPQLPKLDQGCITLNALPGLGITPDLAALKEFQVPHHY